MNIGCISQLYWLVWLQRYKIFSKSQLGMAQAHGGKGAGGMGAHEDARLHLHQSPRQALAHSPEAAPFSLGEAQEEEYAHRGQG